MPVLAVAAISARMMAEAAARDGFDVVALDLFGDADTRRAAAAFVAIGEPGSLHIDAARVLAALRGLAARGDVMGWVAGSGFEGRPELLAQASLVLPLIGTAPGDVRRVRDPALFFAFLAAQGIGHPKVQSAPPAKPSGWLVKDADGCGGWHIRRLTRASGSLPQRHYFQREAAGVPMSATFIADGSRAVLLGCNEQIVRPVAGRPFVFCGAVGPVPLAGDVAQRVGAAVRAITAEFALRGLCSLDFMLDGARIDALEINPRPPASMALYGEQALMRMHVRACLHAELPPVAQAAPRASGHRIVFARRTLVPDDSALRRLAEARDLHDLPGPGQRFEAGDPVCSLSASAADAAKVKTLLEARSEELLRALETVG